MNGTVASAVFDSHADAERAVSELQSAGVRREAISFVTRHDETGAGGDHDGDGEAGEKAGDALSKTAAGAGLGALLGVAALAIPGVGPLAAAGAIAQSAIGGAALGGTAAGAAVGGLTSLLTKHGVDEHDAKYYEDRVHGGGVLLTVDTGQAGVDNDRVEHILQSAGGHRASRAH